MLSRCETCLRTDVGLVEVEHYPSGFKYGFCERHVPVFGDPCGRCRKPMQFGDRCSGGGIETKFGGPICADCWRAVYPQEVQ